MKKIKKGDDVLVRTGKDKGKVGRVIRVYSCDKVLVEGINQVRKTQKANPNAGTSGALIIKDMPIHISNIGLYNPATKKPERVGFKVLENGEKIRFFKSSNEVIGV
jgi:large subunit ribosomal protein L24